MAKAPPKVLYTPNGPIPNPAYAAWVKNNKPTTNKSNNSGGSGGGGGGGGGPTGRTDPDTGKKLSPGEMTADQIAKYKIRIKDNYKNLFDGKAPNMPPGLMEYLLRTQKNDVASIREWLRRNNEKVFVKTTYAKKRAEEANQQLDEIFGENAKFKANFLKKYVLGAEDMTWDKFLETKVINSQAFKAAFPGWDEYYKRTGGDYGKAIQGYRKSMEDYLATYRRLMNKPDADLPPALARYAIEHGMDAGAFEAYAKSNDPGYLDTATPRTKADTIDDFWRTVYGEDATVPPDLRKEWMMTGADDSFGDFFNNRIRNRDDFKAKYPGFEEWAKNQYGDVEGTGMHVDPMDYFKRLQELRQRYEVISEKPGATNEELIRRALEGNWSDARFDLEFKNSDPNYSATGAYKERRSRIDRYWRSIFGSDAQTDPAVADAWAKGNSEDVTSMFDVIKGTAEFQAQYGNWAEFAEAQDFAGNSGAIIENPALYKQYRDAFYDAFRRMGIEPPAGYESMFFKSGMDESEIAQNVQNYVATEASYEWQSGQKADMGTAVGLTGGTAGGDLRQKMEAALAQHRTYSNSKFQQYRNEEDNDFITRKI